MGERKRRGRGDGRDRRREQWGGLVLFPLSPFSSFLPSLSLSPSLCPVPPSSPFLPPLLIPSPNLPPLTLLLLRYSPCPLLPKVIASVTNFQSLPLSLSFLLFSSPSLFSSYFNLYYSIICCSVLYFFLFHLFSIYSHYVSLLLVTLIVYIIPIFSFIFTSRLSPCSPLPLLFTKLVFT